MMCPGLDGVRGYTCLLLLHYVWISLMARIFMPRRKTNDNNVWKLCL